MIGGIVVMLFMTFGLSRLILYFLPLSFDERAKSLWANLGALLIIGAIYAAITISESKGPVLIFLGLALATPCQAIWCWRDLRKIAPRDPGYRSIPSPPLRGASPQPAPSPRPREQSLEPSAPRAERQERWLALLRFDQDVETAANQLRPHGAKWVDELGRSFFAMNEDKQYLPNIVARLLEDAAAERAANWGRDFQRAIGGGLSASALDVLHEMKTAGYQIEVEGRSIAVSKNNGRTYLYDDADVQRYGRILLERTLGQLKSGSYQPE